jgi:hypothetical protein
MKSYFLKLGDRQEGPYSETQIAQMFADRTVDRSTPCKTDPMGDWRTVDEYLPKLKYGTDLPAASPSSSVFTKSPPGLPGTNVAITDVNVPFSSVLKMTLKVFAAWLIVVACITPVIIMLWFIVFAIIAAFVGHAISLPTSHSP